MAVSRMRMAYMRTLRMENTRGMDLLIPCPGLMTCFQLSLGTDQLRSLDPKAWRRPSCKGIRDVSLLQRPWSTIPSYFRNWLWYQQTVEGRATSLVNHVTPGMLPYSLLS